MLERVGGYFNNFCRRNPKEGYEVSSSCSCVFIFNYIHHNIDHISKYFILGPCQMSFLELFTKILNGFYVPKGPKWASDVF